MKNSIYRPIIYSLLIVSGLFLGMFLSGNKTANPFFSRKYTSYEKISDVLNYIQDSYVDTVNTAKVTEDAINYLLQSLDPHSYYISASEFNEVNDPLEGSFEGIGVEFRIIKDTIVVINTVAGGPSEEKGVKAGDRIVKVDDSLVAGIKITNKQVMKKLKGKGGTKVKISVKRQGFKNLIDLTITRGKIPTYSIDIAYKPTSDIGYIKISKFSATTTEEFSEAIDKLTKSGMKKLVLDLRGNGGGYLDAAITLADELLPDNKLIMYTEGAHKKKKTYFSTSEGTFENNDLIILIDEFSASASEIVAGAIQDNDRGIIIGRRSFGKGLVQEQLQLTDGSAIRLTVARYHTPSGRCIQSNYSNGIDDYYSEFYKRFIDGELENQDSIHLNDSLKYKTTKGRTVYGGGGIMPDIFIPIDKEERTNLYMDLINKGLIYQYAFDFSDQNRKMLVQYKNATGFISNFFVTDAILDELIKYAEKNNVKYKEDEFLKSKELIKLQLKAYIGRNIFKDDAFYPIILINDKAFLKAIELLKSNKPLL
jgi:carboxyl-terminal processing protease